MATTYFFFFFFYQYGRKHSSSTQEKCFLQDSTVPSILEVTMVTCLLPRTTGRTWEGACCECGHVHSSGGQEVLHPGIVVTALRSGTNIPALISSSGVRTSAPSYLPLSPSTKGNVVGEVEGNGGTNGHSEKPGLERRDCGAGVGEKPGGLRSMPRKELAR